MKVTIAGWVHQNVIRSKPVIELFIDGYYLASTPIIDGGGHYILEAVVPEWMVNTGNALLEYHYAGVF